MHDMTRIIKVRSRERERERESEMGENIIRIYTKFTISDLNVILFCLFSKFIILK
jgi:hypothetical protein